MDIYSGIRQHLHNRSNQFLTQHDPNPPEQVRYVKPTREVQMSQADMHTNKLLQDAYDNKNAKIKADHAERMVKRRARQNASSHP